jgi:hypothetical protein
MIHYMSSFKSTVSAQSIEVKNNVIKNNYIVNLTLYHPQKMPLAKITSY